MSRTKQRKVIYHDIAIFQAKGSVQSASYSYNAKKQKRETERESCKFFLSLPTSENSCSSNAVNTKGEGSHAKITIVGLAHLLYMVETSCHIVLQFIVYLLFIPHKSLDILQASKKKNWKL